MMLYSCSAQQPKRGDQGRTHQTAQIEVVQQLRETNVWREEEYGCPLLPYHDVTALRQMDLSINIYILNSV